MACTCPTRRMSHYNIAKLRAPGDKSWQVLQATIDRQSLGRVLDLTTDPRWQKFMSRPMYPGTNNANLNRSRLEYVRMKNELYGQFFKEFQQAHNIDIKDFDAVVGPNTFAAASSFAS